MTHLLRALAFASILGAAAPAPALAQPYVAEAGPYTMRASVVPSQQLAAATAREHGVQTAADRGVLNVVVLERSEGGAPRPVPAEVDATRINLVGQPESIPMREMRVNDGISYLGTFEFSPLRTLRFAVRATPSGSGETLAVEFDHRFVVR